MRIPLTLKRLVMYGVLLGVLGSNGRADQIQAKSGDQKPPAPISVIPKQQHDSESLKPEDQKNVHADVKIVNPPQKDFYDKASVWISVVLVFITLGTGIVICWQAIETRRAAKAAIASVGAADRQYRLAEQTSKRQLRAYLCTDIAYMQYESAQPTAYVSFKNSGQTPAREVHGWIRVAIGAYPVTPGTLTVPLNAGIMLSKNTIGAGGVAKLIGERTDPFSEAERLRIDDPHYAFYAYGQLKYIDVFGDDHHTTFRLIVGGKEPPRSMERVDGKKRYILTPDMDGNTDN